MGKTWRHRDKAKIKWGKKEIDERDPSCEFSIARIVKEDDKDYDFRYDKIERKIRKYKNFEDE